jgi:hypothetical protein
MPPAVPKRMPPSQNPRVMRLPRRRGTLGCSHFPFMMKEGKKFDCSLVHGVFGINSSFDKKPLLE